MLVKKEIVENSSEAATMEHGASRSVQEQLQTETIIETVTVHTDREINPNSLKPEPGLAHSVRSEPALLVKEEILEDGSHDSSEQQRVHDAATPVGTGGMNETCNTSLDDFIDVKYESADIDIGPTVLQHMDVHYTINKNVSATIEEISIVDDCNEARPGSEVKKGSAADKSGGFLVPQKAVTKELSECHTLQKHHLTDVKNRCKSICRVQLVRLDTFQCSLCGVVYTEKLRFSQHFQNVHGYHAADKGTSQNCAQTTTQVDYDEANMKNLLTIDARLEKVDLQKDLLHQHGTSSSNGFKCDTTFRKPQLLSARNKLHQRNNKKAVTIKCTVADPPNQSGDKVIKSKQKPFVEPKNHLVNYATRKNHYRHDKKFAKSVDLIKNIGVHMGHKPFQCKICHAKFAHRCDLIRHMRVHTGEKPYECDVCHVKFSLKGNLTRHKTRHTGEKPYKCDTCHAKFAQRGDLIIHIRVHTGEKPYECDSCHAKFAQGGALTTHMRAYYSVTT